MKKKAGARSKTGHPLFSVAARIAVTVTAAAVGGGGEERAETAAVYGQKRRKAAELCVSDAAVSFGQIQQDEKKYGLIHGNLLFDKIRQTFPQCGRMRRAQILTYARMRFKMKVSKRFARSGRKEQNMKATLLLDGRTQSLVEEYVPEGEILEGLVSFFSIFADATRLRILSALAITEICVTDISRVLDINQTPVSHQPRFLKNVGLVTAERLRKLIFYSLKTHTVNDVLLKGVEFLGY